jgi:hypothetical protein
MCAGKEVASGHTEGNREVVYGTCSGPCSHGGWRSFDLDQQQLQESGHEVIVDNVHELRAISHRDRKSDKEDVEKLARCADVDPEILRPTARRTVEQQEALTRIRAQDLLGRLLRFGWSKRFE